MTRAELIEQLTLKFTRLQLKDIDMSVRVIIDGMSNALAHGGRAEVRGFGSFTLNYKPPRNARNPKTGVSVKVPAKYMPHFKAGKELKERVDFH
jgi:integration host factor subunit beta